MDQLSLIALLSDTGKYDFRQRKLALCGLWQGKVAVRPDPLSTALGGTFWRFKAERSNGKVVFGTGGKALSLPG